jgi:hypothetical protein
MARISLKIQCRKLTSIFFRFPFSSLSKLLEYFRQAAGDTGKPATLHFTWMTDNTDDTFIVTPSSILTCKFDYGRFLPELTQDSCIHVKFINPDTNDRYYIDMNVLSVVQKGPSTSYTMAIQLITENMADQPYTRDQWLEFPYLIKTLRFTMKKKSVLLSDKFGFPDMSRTASKYYHNVLFVPFLV